MSIVNEELLDQLQRAAVLARRNRHAASVARHGRGDEAPKADGCPEFANDSSRGHRANRNRVAFDDPDATHGYGNHKAHGGSGRHGQNRVLATLVLQDGLSQKDLAYLLAIRPQSLSQALDRLEEEGFVERRHNEEDKRVINVFLTDKGRGRANKVAEDRKNTASDIFSVLTEEEKEQFNTIMDKIIAAIDEQLGEKAPRK